ncbi:MAG: hypothetical protein ACOYOF_06835, partial [Verrucomicrobiaceae bacterium]
AMTSDLILYQFSRDRGEAGDAKDFYWRFASLRNGAMVSPWCMTIHDTRSSLPCDILQRHPPFHLQEGPDLRRSSDEPQDSFTRTVLCAVLASK